MSRPPRILVAPLNWGLGHATRSIPIIRLLRERGCDVLLASDGPALTLLEQEFPDLPTFALPGFEVRYGERFFALTLLGQLPSLLGAVRREHRAMAALVSRERVDGVISDNRFGSWGSGVPDIVLSHQWTVETGNAVSGFMATRLHRRILRRYGECWIPDNNDDGSLAGRLSEANDPNTKHIGPVSRLVSGEKGTAPSRSRTKVLVICSGPEPLRTRLERTVLEQARQLPHTFLIARGLPGQAPTPSPLSNVEWRAHLGTHELSNALVASDVVVSRTGYTTLMDLAATGAKALLIPTPGQPEQEYLGRYHAGNGWWAIQEQTNLDLATGIEQALTLPGAPRIVGATGNLEHALDTFLHRIRTGLHRIKTGPRRISPA